MVFSLEAALRSATRHCPHGGVQGSWREGDARGRALFLRRGARRAEVAPGAAGARPAPRSRGTRAWAQQRVSKSPPRLQRGRASSCPVLLTSGFVMGEKLQNPVCLTA